MNGPAITPSLSQADAQVLNEFIWASRWSDSRRVLEANLQLLGEECDAHLGEQITAARQKGYDQTAAILEYHRAVLGRCRQAGIAMAFSRLTDDIDAVSPELKLTMQEADGAERQYNETGNPQALHAAARGWKEVLSQDAWVARPGRRLELLDVLARHALAKYRSNGERIYLDWSIASLEEAVEGTPPFHAAGRPDRLSRLGEALLDRWELQDQPADLDRAVHVLEEAVEHATPDAPTRAHALSNLGFALHRRFVREDRPEDLDRAVEALAQLVETTALDAAKRAEQLTSLARVLLDRWELKRQTTDLDRAVHVLEEAVRHTPVDAPERAERLAGLGTTTLTRFMLTRQLLELDRAVVFLQEALRLTPADAPERAERLSNLGTAWFSLYEARGDMDHLDWAVNVLEEALGASPPGAPERASVLSNLGSCLRVRYFLRHRNSDLDRAVAAFEQTLETTSSGDPWRASRLSNLATGLSSRYERDGQLADLDRAVELSREAVGAPGSQERATFLVNLASHLRLRHLSSGRAADLEQARSTYAQACELGLETDAEAVLTAARAWGWWATDRGAWSEAAEAYGYGLRAAGDVYRAQLLPSHKESSLQEVQDLPGLAAYARARAGDLRGAVMALEQGRALLLSEKLEQDRDDLARLRELGHSELAARYHHAARRLTGLQSAHPGSEWPTLAQDDLSNELGRAHATLQATIEAIRALPGYERFLEPPTFDDVLGAADGGPLVYLESVRHGGVALFVGRGSQPTAAWLPELRLEVLLAKVQDYLEAYNQRDQDRDRWLATLDGTTRWLWDSVMASVLRATRPAPRVTLIPAGSLGLLPLHAAWVNDQRRPNGRRYALDEALFAYSPNAVALRTALDRAARAANDGVLGVEEPLPVDAPPLPSAKHEVQAALAAFPNRQHLRHGEATRSAVLATLADWPVVHFACHGYARTAEPLSSALIMANDEALTLRDILDCRLNANRLTVLSACETSLSGTKLPDEVVSLPTGLLQAGAAGVIASLWSVNDASTAAVMSRFYHLWRKEGLDPCRALRQAQQQARDLPGLSHPYYWAAFSYVGA